MGMPAGSSGQAVVPKWAVLSRTSGSAEGDVEEGAEFGVPGEGAEVEEEGAGGVGGVGGEGFSGGEAVEEVGVDGAEEGVAGEEFGAKVGVFTEECGEFWGGEVAVNFEAGFGGDEFVLAVGDECGAGVVAAAALPDDGVVEGAAGGAVEEDECFSLVGDGEAERMGGVGMIFQGALDDGEGVAPEFFGVVFDAAGGGVMGGVVDGEAVEEVALEVVDEGFGRGSALVDGEDVGGLCIHCLPFTYSWSQVRAGSWTEILRRGRRDHARVVWGRTRCRAWPTYSPRPSSKSLPQASLHHGE